MLFLQTSYVILYTFPPIYSFTPQTQAKYPFAPNHSLTTPSSLFPYAA
jgi:hypothetical protein